MIRFTKLRIGFKALALLMVLNYSQSAAQTFPSYTIETYEESARLKRDNASLQIENDTLPHNYMIVLTFSDSIQRYSDSLPRVSKILIKVGASSGSSDFFEGTFTLNEVGNIPAKTYYGVNGNKHYIKVYLENISKTSSKNYSVQLENKEGSRSSSTTGAITQ